MVAREQKRLAQPPRAGAGVSGADGVPRGAPGLARRKNRVWFASKSVAACACCARAGAVFLHNFEGHSASAGAVLPSGVGRFNAYAALSMWRTPMAANHSVPARLRAAVAALRGCQPVQCWRSFWRS